MTKPSGADRFQVKWMSCRRFKERLGWVTEDELEDVLLTIAFCLGK